MFPRWLPLYLLGIAALTLFPFAAADCSRPGWGMKMGTFDFAANLVAFLPIGMALYRSPALRMTLLALGLSLTIELCQQWLPRQQDVTDLLANTSGAGVGWVVARFWTARWPGPVVRSVTRHWMLRATVVAILGAVAVQAAMATAHDFSNWESFPAIIGNSAWGDRPWTGQVSELEVYDRALGAAAEPTPGADTSGGAGPDAPPLWAEGGPILWVRFAGQEPVGRVDGPGGPIAFSPQVEESTFLSQAGLALMPSGVVLQPWVSEHLIERLREVGAMTVDAQLRPRSLYQRGPAKIFAIGDGRRRRNLVLAQRGSRYVAQIRTPANGLGGARVEVETEVGAVTTTAQRLRLEYDGSGARLSIDGACVEDTPIGIYSAPLLLGSLLGVSIVICTAFGGMAAGSLVRRRTLRVLLTIAGGSGTWLFLRALDLWQHLPGFETEAAVLGVAAIAAALPVILRRAPDFPTPPVGLSRAESG